jgi:hypothetical protein
MKKTIWAALLLCTSAYHAHAKDAPYRVKVSERTGTGEFFDKSFPVALRSTAPGRQVVLEKLLAGFTGGVGKVFTGNVKDTKESLDATVASGKGWFLEVDQKGEVFRYRNTDELNKVGVGVPLAQRMSDADAIERATKFVRESLGDTVVLGEGETLNPWYVSFKIVVSGLASKVGEEPDKRVSAVKVVFTRAIDGVPVLGNGSKVTVFMTHDGNPAGFEVNWARLQRGTGEERSIGRSGAHERVSRVEHANTAAREAATSTYLECGLYDSGIGEAGARLQSACLHSYSLASPASGLVSRMSRIDAVPIGTVVQREKSWAEAEVFASP